MLELTAELTEATAELGIVGTRQPVAIQTFDIARLTSHPVVLVPGTFIAVGGRGPTDSNESSKTSFLAATSLLLGDPGWGMTGGGPSSVADLLFDPRTAGVRSESYAPARHGYIVGVFCEPETPDETVITVWCRLNATAEYFEVRYADGLHLVEGDSDHERHAAADAAWSAMPVSTQLGAKFYAERLYGDSPRCLAFVTDRGKRQSKPSLLQMNAGQFTPQQIGDDLIRLTGRAGAFTTEAEHRERLDEAQRKLSGREKTDALARRQEEDDLLGVRARNTAREKLAQAEDAWKLHFALGYIDALNSRAVIEQELAAAEDNLAAASRDTAQAKARVAELSLPEQLKEANDAAQDAYDKVWQAMQSAIRKDAEAKSKAAQLQKRERELDQFADGWQGSSVQTLTDRLASAGKVVEIETEAVGVARVELASAQERLADAETGAEGAAGETAAVLAAAGVPAAPLMDLELTVREDWEPRLALFRDAVVVAPGHFNDALRACADRAGAVLIDGSDEQLPAGIASAPSGTGRFLNALARTPTDHDPLRASHSEFHAAVIGGFSEPQAGRAARVERARAALARTEQALNQSQRTLDQAKANERLIAADLQRAQAAEQLVSVRADLAAAQTSAHAAAQAVADLGAPLAEADAARTIAAAKVEGHEALRAAAEEALRNQRKDETAAQKERDDVRKCLEDLPVAYWAAGWSGTPEAAAEAARCEPLAEKALRTRAAMAVRDALLVLGIDIGTGEGAATPELARAAQHWDALTEDPNRTHAPKLQDVSGPLRDHLDTHQEQDLIVEDRTTTLREQRDAELTYAREASESPTAARSCAKLLRPPERRA